MTAVTDPLTSGSASTVEPTNRPIVAVKRRTVDTVLISLGLVFALVLGVAGGLLTWGGNFANDYVRKELVSQKVSFPDAAGLTTEKRTDLLKFAGQQVTTGSQAQGYASYINGHLAAIGGGKTFAELNVPLTAAKADVKAATDAGKAAADIAPLQAKVDQITATRATMFQGETLRGLLLTAYAWSTIGRIAGIAAVCAFFACGLMVLLVAFGLVHLRRLAHRQAAAEA